MRQKLLLLIFPLLTFGAGVAVLLIGYWDYRKEIREVETLFSDHVDSLAALITEGAAEAAASTSLTYEIAEDHLSATAHLLTLLVDPTGEAVSSALDEHGITVHLILQADGSASGNWGPVPEPQHAAFVSWLKEAPENLLIDDGPAATYNIACLRYGELQQAGIICLDGDQLAMLRREIGIGPLLTGVIQKDVRYAVLQDAEGILAGAPADAEVSRWQDDPALEAALKTQPRKRTARLQSGTELTLFEGLVPFQMADESWVLLRVGIDAGLLKEIQTKAERRFAVTLIAAAAVSLTTAVLALLLFVRIRASEAMERKLREREADRRHWEMIGQMAATVAHEVRNPLNTLGMAAQRLRREFNVPGNERDEFVELLDLLVSESERVGRTVTEFLDLGKPLTLSRERCMLADLVKTALFPLQMRAEKEHKQLTIQHDTEAAVFVDPEQFRRMVTNLVENALDAVSENGRVTVRTGRKDEDAVVAVEDNGPGLSPERLTDVQQPFVSFKKTGTGLGLPLVRRIAAAHDGRFHIRSTEGVGTEAAVHIPAVERNRHD